MRVIAREKSTANILVLMMQHKFMKIDLAVGLTSYHRENVGSLEVQLEYF